MMQDCIEYPFGKTGRGYGMFFVTGDEVFVYAHRFVWESENGPIPLGLKVLHHCDNPPCVNFSHLFLGTTKDNTQDMLSKHREYRGPSIGPNLGRKFSKKWRLNISKGKKGSIPWNKGKKILK